VPLAQPNPESAAVVLGALGLQPVGSRVPAGRSTNATATRSGLAQETVLHLLTKRRQDPVPGWARRNLTAKRAAALLDQVAPTGARRSPAACWPISTTGMPSHSDPLIAFPTQLHGE
jgi:1,6-anhydro-N-acetylmuramate kinase